MYHVLNNFGRYLEELRLEKGVTIEELARRLEVTPGIVKRWVSKQYRGCSLGQVCQILRALSK